jgi:hypothetical protein
MGWDSSVGIVTRYMLDGVKFSAPVQTSPGNNPASYTMGTGSFLGVQRPGCGVDHPTPSSAKAKERVALYLYSVHIGLLRMDYSIYIYLKHENQESHVSYPSWSLQTPLTKTIQYKSKPVCSQQGSSAEAEYPEAQVSRRTLGFSNVMFINTRNKQCR